MAAAVAAAAAACHVILRQAAHNYLVFDNDDQRRLDQVQKDDVAAARAFTSNFIKMMRNFRLRAS